MKPVLSLTILILAAMIFSGTCFAEEIKCADGKQLMKCPICGAALSNNYFSKAGGRFARGLTNAALGWTDLFIPVVKDVQDKASVGKGCSDVGWGGLNAFSRTAGGIVDVFTFWEPQIQNDKMSCDCSLGRVGLVDK